MMRRTLIPILVAIALSARGAQPVHARHGMVVAAEFHAADAGLDVLRAGGNAVDAAILWEDGWLAGAADPRSESAARGY
ncbi:MAG: hypothetical protein ABSE42_03045 [Bryobacteraceae bacterium]